MGHFAAFGIFRLAEPADAGEFVAALAAVVDARARTTPGFLLSRVHLTLDGSTLVHHTRWTSEQNYRLWCPDDAALGEPGPPYRHAAVRTAVTVTGIAAGGIRGPAVGQPPRVAAVAIRHFAGPEPAAAVLGLLHRSGQWKRDHPGFIAADVCLSADGRTFVNYPVWTGRGAYEAWMADPRISAGQAEVARLELAPPQYFVCTVEHDVVGHHVSPQR
ncbi:antibiotic biosynthesis monooxygenase [Micromonospora sp. NPDC049102]|uniref:antibiotic biosynthesis monooxygenase n=1 Tax=Micromonospora sp. NPDC049102 TaxID=3364265 RepID=UPI00371CED51